MRMVFRTALASVLLTAMALVVSGSLALACNKDFKVYNKTDQSITQFYVSPHSSDKWEDNVLNSDIEPDTNTRVDMSDDTRDVSLYDVKAVFEDGTKVTGGKINLCRARSVYIYADRVTFEE